MGNTSTSTKWEHPEQHSYHPNTNKSRSNSKLQQTKRNSKSISPATTSTPNSRASLEAAEIHNTKQSINPTTSSTLHTAPPAPAPTTVSPAPRIDSPAATSSSASPAITSNAAEQQRKSKTPRPSITIPNFDSLLTKFENASTPVIENVINRQMSAPTLLQDQSTRRHNKEEDEFDALLSMYLEEKKKPLAEQKIDPEPEQQLITAEDAEASTAIRHKLEKMEVTVTLPHGNEEASTMQQDTEEHHTAVALSPDTR